MNDEDLKSEGSDSRRRGTSVFEIVNVWDAHFTTLLRKLSTEKKHTDETKSEENKSEDVKVAQEASEQMIKECFAKLNLTHDSELYTKFSIVQKDTHNDAAIIAFLKALQDRGILHQVLSWIVKYDIEKNKNGLLREESLGANFLKHFWFYFEGQEYLKQLVKPLVNEVISLCKHKSLEIDPNKASNPSDIEKNIKTMQLLASAFLDRLFKSHSYFPSEFRAILRDIYGLLTEIESAQTAHLGLGFSENALKLFGAFLILRFLCPALVTPKTYHIVKSEPNFNSLRALILVSKILQNIANQAEFGEKEAYMKPLNDFLLDYTPKMLAFLHTLMKESPRDRLEDIKPQKARGVPRSPSFKQTLQIITDTPTELPEGKLKSLKKTVFLHQQGPQDNNEGDRQEIPSPAVFCKSNSTFPLINATTREADPICDYYCVKASQNAVYVTLCDGCNWGPRVRQAARTASVTFTNYLVEHTSSMKTVAEAGKCLMTALDKAHAAVIAEHEDMWQAGQTSLVGGVLTRVQYKNEKKWAFTFLSVGNCKAFRWHNNATSVIDISPFHCSDVSEFNSGDTGGRIGPFQDDGKPDLRNRKLHYFECEEGDIIFLCSSGVALNFDPQELDVPPKLTSSGTDFDNWSELINDPRARDAKNSYRVKKLNNLLAPVKDNISPEVISSKIIDACMQLTAKGREYMEQNPGTKQPRDKAQFPGRFSHVTCVAVRVGKVPQISKSKLSKQRSKE